MDVNLEMEMDMVDAVLKVVKKKAQIIQAPILMGAQSTHLWVTELPLMVN